MSSDGGRGRPTRAAELDCAAPVDAMGRIHSHRAHVLALTSPDPARPLFGPASTIAYLAYRDDLPQTGSGSAELFHEAVGQHPHGRVLVLSSGGHPEASHGGGTELSRGEASLRTCRRGPHGPVVWDSQVTTPHMTRRAIARAMK